MINQNCRTPPKLQVLTPKRELVINSLERVFIWIFDNLRFEFWLDDIYFVTTEAKLTSNLLGTWAYHKGLSHRDCLFRESFLDLCRIQQTRNQGVWRVMKILVPIFSPKVRCEIRVVVYFPIVVFLTYSQGTSNQYKLEILCKNNCLKNNLVSKLLFSVVFIQKKQECNCFLHKIIRIKEGPSSPLKVYLR